MRINPPLTPPKRGIESPLSGGDLGVGKKVVGFCLVQPNLFIEDKIMKKIFIFIVTYSIVIGLGVISSSIGKNIYGLFFPRQLGEGFFELFTPGIIEGFLFMYLFWLGLLFVPVFKDKWWRYALAPALIIFLPFILFWQIALFGILFFAVGVGLGYVSLWMRKKFN